MRHIAMAVGLTTYLLDRHAGTRPGKDSIYKLWKAFDVNPHCAGACGEIKAMLEQAGHEVAVVNDGAEAVRMAIRNEFDAILMDVQMPEMDGFEATRMLRVCLEIQPVIIAMTANVMQGDRDDCLRSGMDDYMSKPIEMDELLIQLTKWGQVIKDRRGVPN